MNVHFFIEVPVRAGVWPKSRNCDAHKAVSALPEMCRIRVAEWAERNQEYAFTEKDKGNKT